MLFVLTHISEYVLLHYYQFRFRKAREKYESVENDEALEEQLRNRAAQWKNKIKNLEK